MPYRPFIIGKKTANYATSCKKHRIGFTQISDLVLFSICIITAWVGIIPFTGRFWLRLLLAVIGGLLLSWAVRKWLAGRRLIFIKEQFKWLLEHLLTRITAGATLESAFLDASAGLGKILGKNALLLSGLVLLEKQLSAHLPLIQVLPQFSRFLPCPEAQRFMAILPELSQAGGQISQFIRQQLGMILEQLSLQQDISAESTQRRTEAVLLAMMPFLITFLLQESSAALSGGLMNASMGTVSMILAWIMAISAAAITISALDCRMPLNHRPPKMASTSTRKPMPKILLKVAHWLLIFYQNYLPAAYGGRLLQCLQNDPGSSVLRSCTSTAAYFHQKAVCMLLAMLPSSLLIQANPKLWYCLPIMSLLISIIQDQLIFRIARQRQTDYQMEYPIFLNLIASLLQSGLSVHVALDICIRACLPDAVNKLNRIDETSIDRDMVEIRKNLQIGRPANQILEKIAASCPVAEARAALLLIAKYDRNGGQEILVMLQMQSTSCQALYRNTARKQLERQSMHLLLPMTLDLMSVIIITILPAVLSLQSI